MNQKAKTEVYQRLVEAIADNRAIAMIGAGSSVRVGFPNWSDLLKMLYKEAIKKEHTYKNELDSLAKTNDDLVYANKIKEILGPEEFAKQLKDIFGPEKPKYDKFHEILIDIPFCHFLTTNYDRVIQNAYESTTGKIYKEFDLDEQEKLRYFIDEHHSVNIEKHFVHVHGSIKRPEKIVLTYDEYNDRYVNTEVFRRALEIIFAGRQIIFIGFSFNDIDVMCKVSANCILRDCVKS